MRGCAREVLANKHHCQRHMTTAAAAHKTMQGNKLMAKLQVSVACQSVADVCLASMLSLHWLLLCLCR